MFFVLWCAVLCYAVLCYAVLCCAVSCSPCLPLLACFPPPSSLVPFPHFSHSSAHCARFLRLQRDMALLTGLGFSEVMAQKALFVASGTHTEALAWLIHHQHHPNVDVPWNSTQLQEQVALRNTRRVLCGVDVDPSTQPLIPGHLNVAVSIVRHVEALGRRAWMVATRGFGALGMPEIVFLLKWETDVSWRARVCVCLCVCVCVYVCMRTMHTALPSSSHSSTHAHTHTHTHTRSLSLPLSLSSCALHRRAGAPCHRRRRCRSAFCSS